MITIDIPGLPSKEVHQEPLTEDEFEKVIDILEKVYQITRSKNPDSLSKYFYNKIDYADESLGHKINPVFLKNKLIRYYNFGKRCYFIRKFWENPDANDPDSKAAFKKRNENTKMELRKSQNVIKKKQQKKKVVKEKTVEYVLANLLPQIFNREAVKQSLD